MEILPVGDAAQDLFLQVMHRLLGRNRCLLGLAYGEHVWTVQLPLPQDVDQVLAADETGEVNATG